ncbi:MAG: DUF2065 domain-containing protein [Thiotrichales bacterium]|nr:MAG: DUF2065 domain-containing protein [Thiotrichales bacterium]
MMQNYPFWHFLLIAIGLVLVIEGILPFAAPEFYKKIMQKILSQSINSLRITGLCSMLVGATIIYMMQHLFT